MIVMGIMVGRAMTKGKAEAMQESKSGEDKEGGNEVSNRARAGGGE
jgi:hypothetical protein